MLIDVKGVEDAETRQFQDSSFATEIPIIGKNGQSFKFTAYTGYRFGGSESCNEERLNMTCLVDNRTYCLYESSEYSR